MSQASIKIAKSIIWFCLGVIVLSPLYINSHLFFPYIVTKTVAFNVAVEIMFLAFLWLCWKGGYKLKMSLPVILLGVYIVLTFISSLLGDNFAHSFWSNNERSEGILLLLNLFLFLVILTGFLRTMKDWLALFDMLFIAGILVALVALGQYFNLSWVLASSGGQRLAGTIGNAGYMAGYLFFTVFAGLFLLFRRQNISLKIYYAIFILLDIFIIFNTYTRGGIIALIIASFGLGLYLALFYFSNNKNIRNTVIGILIVTAVLGGVLLLNKNSSLVRSNAILSRVTDISTGSNTAQNRLWTWKSAFKGAKDRSILGWGYENFYQPFDKYFDPRISRKAGSVVWFDRAHNVILDRLVTGGILGLLSYLSLLFVPLFYLWREYKKKKGDNKKYIIPMLCTITMLGYFIQNLFIFEALVIYVPLFMMIGFIGAFGPDYNWKFLNSRNFKLTCFVVWLIALLPVLYIFTMRPLNANIDLTKALSSQSLTIDQRIDLFKSVLGRNTSGNQEYRRQLLDFAEMILKSGNGSMDNKKLSDFLKFTDDELQKQLVENPNSVANYLLMMRFNDVVYSLTSSPVYLNANLALAEKALPLAPNRQHLYYEIGYSYFYLADYYKNNTQPDLAKKNYDLAINQFEKALRLNDVNFDSYQQLANILIYAGENNKLKTLFGDIPGLQKKAYGAIDMSDFFNRMLGVSVQAKNMVALDFFGQEYMKLKPQDPQSYIQTALAYAYLGNNDKAISLAEKVAAMGPQYATQTADFIAKVKKGEYKK